MHELVLVKTVLVVSMPLALLEYISVVPCVDNIGMLVLIIAEVSVSYDGLVI